MRKFALITLAALLGAAPLAACKKGVDPAVAAAASAEATKNLADAKAFLAKNAMEPGVVSLPDGLQYKIVTSGAATGIKPKPQDEVKIHYEGKFISGKVFDSSFERGSPTTFVLGQLVPAWIEGLQLMRPGDEWMLYVPPELGYGAEGKGEDMPPNSALIFRIQLIDVLQNPA